LKKVLPLNPFFLSGIIDKIRQECRMAAEGFGRRAEGFGKLPGV
jgi:hypothetical protein